jgi:hypothetical protein
MRVKWRCRAAEERQQSGSRGVQRRCEKGMEPTATFSPDRKGASSGRPVFLRFSQARFSPKPSHADPHDSVPTDTSPSGWGGTVDYGIIIAGDGYAYTSYAYQDGAGNMHLRLLQVGTSGASNKIEVREWAPGTSIDIGEGDMRVDMITNADQGVLISWEAPVFSPSSLSTTWDRNMAITTGTSFSIINGSVIPGQQSDLVPVLQAQDGSFVGIARPSGWTPYMVAFDASGNPRWVVPNDQPQIATADGGVIGQSGITYDANGNATGMIPQYTQSWTGHMYQDGPVELFYVLPNILATSFWAFAGANNSDNSTAAQPLPDRVKAIYDGVSPYPGGAGAVQRNITYLPYQGPHQVPNSKQAVITEKLLYSYGQQPSPSYTKPGEPFDDVISTAGKGSFGITQQLFVSLPGSRSYRVQIVPCAAAPSPPPPNAFGTPAWQNIIKATDQTVLINQDPGSTTARTCQ